jgi:hypothetical protein
MLAAAMALFWVIPWGAAAQGSDNKATEQKPGDKRENAPKRIDDINEAGQQMSGPAANLECIWLGRRVVSLLWRDDLDTAFRHLDIYDRFGCPGGQIQGAFRCVLRQGDIDPKATDTLNARIHTCWINPSQPAAAAAAPPPAAAAVPPPAGGTTAR